MKKKPPKYKDLQIGDLICVDATVDNKLRFDGIVVRKFYCTEQEAHAYTIYWSDTGNSVYFCNNITSPAFENRLWEYFPSH